jgi:cytochrome c5
MRANQTRHRIVVLIIFALSVGSVMLRAQDSTAREVGRQNPAAAMPDGEGKGLVLATCTQCHSLNSTVQQRKPAAEWERTVRDMVARGAQIQPEEMQIIAAYLAKSFPPGAPSLGGDNAPRTAMNTQADPNAPAALPEGTAKAFIVRACIECHSLDRITLRRKDEAGWRASVKDMVRLGAILRPDEESAMIAYLAQHFGRQQTTTATSNESARTNRPADPAQMLPDGEGKGLILATCVQCHALRTVVAQPKDAAAWRRTVHDMVARGAQLTWAEAEIAARYLAEHLSKAK